MRSARSRLRSAAASAGRSTPGPWVRRRRGWSSPAESRRPATTVRSSDQVAVGIPTTEEITVPDANAADLRAGPRRHRAPRRRRLRGRRDGRHLDRGRHRGHLRDRHRRRRRRLRPGRPAPQIPGIRQAEQRAAAKAVGVDDVRFLGYTDGELVVTLDLRRDISRVIRQVRPQRLLCQSPERNWERLPASHPDHLAAGRGGDPGGVPGRAQPVRPPRACCRTRASRPGRSREIWLMGGPRPNRLGRHHRHLRRQDRRAAVPRRPRSGTVPSCQTSCAAGRCGWPRRPGSPKGGSPRRSWSSTCPDTALVAGSGRVLRVLSGAGCTVGA